MKTMIFVVVLILLVLWVSSCSKDPDQITSYTSDEGYHHLNPDSGIPANVDIHFLAETLRGFTTILINGVIHIAYKIAKVDDLSFVYFFDSYIGSGEDSIKSGTTSPINEWIRITVVVYSEGISSIVIGILNGLGLDFIEWIEDWMVEAVYEVDVYLSDDAGPPRISGLDNFEDVTDRYLPALRMNSQTKKFSKYVELNYDSISWEGDKLSKSFMLSEINR